MGKIGPELAASPVAADSFIAALPMRRGELIAVWVFWGFIACVSTLNSFLNDLLSPAEHLPLIAPLLAALIDGAVWGLLTPLIFRAARRYPLEQRHCAATSNNTRARRAGHDAECNGRCRPRWGTSIQVTGADCLATLSFAHQLS
jgi:hypothetical protein